MPKLNLPTVTLCAVTSVNVEATMAALEACLDQVDFAEALLLTDAKVGNNHPAIRVIPIKKLDSARDYSEFILKNLGDQIQSAHCLVIQWDGFVLDSAMWSSHFLDYDYVGAVWPQFDEPYQVGNGGFSLRSRKLMDACRDPDFRIGHPEDVAICRINRPMLEARYGIRFADVATARQFSFERLPRDGATFGFHGVFNIIPTVGPDRFWQTYETLDEPTALLTDYWQIIRQLGSGANAWPRRLRLTAGWLRERFKW